MPTFEPSHFLERLVLSLMPYFAAIIPDPETARVEILETLASYGCRTRSELINAARIIAFSFAALDTLGEAETPEMSVAMRLRYRGCANNLNRSCQQNEQVLAKRLTLDPPVAAEPAAEPVNDVPDPEVDAAIQHAPSEISMARGRLSGTRSHVLPTRPLSPAQQEANNRLWEHALTNILAEMRTQAAPA